MKKTIVFDLGGVLLDWNPRYLYRQLFSDREELDYFLEDVQIARNAYEQRVKLADRQNRQGTAAV